MLIRMVCDGQPVSAKNHQQAYRTASGRVRVRMGQAISDWYATATPRFRQQFAAYGLPPLTGPVHVTVSIYVQHPLGSAVNPDATNVLDGVLDALQHAGVLANDRDAIAGAWAMQYDPTRPRVTVDIRPLPAVSRLPFRTG